MRLSDDVVLIVRAGSAASRQRLPWRARPPLIVLEQAQQFGEIGAGIQLAPNAFHSFDALGIGERAQRGAVFVDELVLMDAVGGERITSIPVGEPFRKRFGNPYAVVHRADLHEALLDACKESELVDLRVSSKVERYEQDNNSVRAILASGNKVSGAALVGADGFGRASGQVVNDGAPAFGHTTFRSVIRPNECRRISAGSGEPWDGPKVHSSTIRSRVGRSSPGRHRHNDAPEPVTESP